MCAPKCRKIFLYEKQFWKQPRRRNHHAIFRQDCNCERCDRQKQIEGGINTKRSASEESPNVNLAANAVFSEQHSGHEKPAEHEKQIDTDPPAVT